MIIDTFTIEIKREINILNFFLRKRDQTNDQIHEHN